MKFGNKKTNAEEDGNTGGGGGAPARTPLSQANPDWSEKTSSLWQEHTNFLERTKVTGIAPPVRGGTITGLIAAEKKRNQNSRRFATFGMLLVIPLTAGGVFFYLNTQEGKVEEPSVAVEEPVVPKNPNKRKKTAEGDPAVPPATAEQKPPVDPDLFWVKEAPYSLGAADSSYKAPDEKFLKPIVELSKSAPAEGDLAPIDRGLSAIDLTREEVSQLTKAIGRDPSARGIAEQWKKEARAAIGVGVHPVAQFRWNTPEERKASELARQELKTMHSMLMASYAFGEQDIAEQMHQSILGWVHDYKPIGDVYSDAELAPLIRAYANVWRRFSPEELKQTDAWLKTMADRQVTEAIQRRDRNDLWFAYHLHTVTLVGFATGNAQLQNYVKRNFSVHLATAIRDDGKTTTLEKTGAMSLHADHLAKLLETTVTLYRVGRVAAETVPLSSNAFGRSVNFTAPYSLGHMPWNDYEKAADPLIAKRQSAGDVAVAVRPYVWRMDTSFLDSLSFFRLQPTLRDVASAIGMPEATYPTPNTLYYDSMIRDVAWIRPQQQAPLPGPRPASVQQPAPQPPANLPPKAK